MRKILKNIYGETVVFRSGRASNYDFDIKEKLAYADIAIYFHEKHEIIVIWNIKYRRGNGSKSHNLSIEQNLNYAKITDGFIDCMYKTFKNDKGSLVYEKVLIMSLSTFRKNIYFLGELIEFDPEDKGFPDVLEPSMKIRGKHTTSTWNRDVNFRKKVLAVYHSKCAICRCEEEKLLEAAHIKPVCEGGTDDVNNGICLCANHHKMLDNGLIKIDYTHMKLSYVSKSVMHMSWYSEFLGRFNGEIIRG